MSLSPLSSSSVIALATRNGEFRNSERILSTSSSAAGASASLARHSAMAESSRPAAAASRLSSESLSSLTGESIINPGRRIFPLSCFNVTTRPPSLASASRRHFVPSSPAKAMSAAPPRAARTALMKALRLKDRPPEPNVIVASVWTPWRSLKSASPRSACRTNGGNSRSDSAARIVFSSAWSLLTSSLPGRDLRNHLIDAIAHLSHEPGVSLWIAMPHIPRSQPSPAISNKLIAPAPVDR